MPGEIALIHFERTASDEFWRYLLTDIEATGSGLPQHAMMGRASLGRQRAAASEWHATTSCEDLDDVLDRVYTYAAARTAGWLAAGMPALTDEGLEAWAFSLTVPRLYLRTFFDGVRDKTGGEVDVKNVLGPALPLPGEGLTKTEDRINLRRDGILWALGQLEIDPVFIADSFESVIYARRKHAPDSSLLLVNPEMPILENHNYAQYPRFFWRRETPELANFYPADSTQRTLLDFNDGQAHATLQDLLVADFPEYDDYYE